MLLLDGDGGGVSDVCDCLSDLMDSFPTLITVPISSLWATTDFLGLIIQALLGLPPEGGTYKSPNYIKLLLLSSVTHNHIIIFIQESLL